MKREIQIKENVKVCLGTSYHGNFIFIENENKDYLELSFSESNALIQAVKELTATSSNPPPDQL
jgi:hypothetical protein